jgi:hypothetical protein
MVNLLGKESFDVECVEGVRIVIREKPLEDGGESRTLCMECGNMMTVPDIEKADIVMLETDVPQVIIIMIIIIFARMDHSFTHSCSIHEMG